MSAQTDVALAVAQARAASETLMGETLEVEEVERAAADARAYIDTARASVLSEYGTLGADLHAALGELARWVQELARRVIEAGATVDEVVTISTLPATLLAMQLFGDPQRAEDIIRLNRPGDPNRLPPGTWRVPRE